MFFFFKRGSGETSGGAVSLTCHGSATHSKKKKNLPILEFDAVCHPESHHPFECNWE